MAHVTIPDQDEEVVSAAFTGSTISFGFVWFEKSDIVVMTGATQAELAESAWSVVAASADTGGNTGGTITFNTPITVATRVVVQRRITPSRATDLSVGGAKPGALNTELDKQAGAARDLFRDVRRSLQLGPGDASSIGFIGDTATRSFKVIAFKTDGTIELVDRADIDAIASIVNEIANLGTADVANAVVVLSAQSVRDDMAALEPVATEMGRLGQTAVITDMQTLSDTDVLADMAALADQVGPIGLLGTTATVEDMQLLAASNIRSAMTTLSATNNLNTLTALKAQIDNPSSSINQASANATSAVNAKDAAEAARNGIEGFYLGGPFATAQAAYDSNPSVVIANSTVYLSTDGDFYTFSSLSPVTGQRLSPVSAAEFGALQAQVAGLAYTAPDVSVSLSTSVVEVGSTVASLTINYTATVTAGYYPAALTLAGQTINIADVSQVSGSVVVTNVTSNTTYTGNITDTAVGGVGEQSGSGSASISFRRRVWWSDGTEAAPGNSAAARALSNSALTNSLNIDLNPPPGSGTRTIHIVFPQSFVTGGQVTVTLNGATASTIPTTDSRFASLSVQDAGGTASNHWVLSLTVNDSVTRVEVAD